MVLKGSLPAFLRGTKGLFNFSAKGGPKKNPLASIAVITSGSNERAT